MRHFDDLEGYQANVAGEAMNTRAVSSRFRLD
jgi:hypothetical protein